MKIHLVFKKGVWCAFRNKESSKYALPVTSDADPCIAFEKADEYLRGGY